MAEDTQNLTPAADGYYGDDASTDEEIDLSFLDDNDEDNQDEVKK